MIRCLCGPVRAHLRHILHGRGVAVVEGALHIDPRAVQQGQQLRQEHGDAAAELAAGRPRQPARRRRSVRLSGAAAAWQCAAQLAAGHP